MSNDLQLRVQTLEERQEQARRRLEKVERWQDTAQVLGAVPPGSPSQTDQHLSAEVGQSGTTRTASESSTEGSSTAAAADEPDQSVSADESDPSSWAALDGELPATLWRQLAAWVDWLVSAYDLRVESRLVPPCWWRHPIATQELAALRCAWLAAHEGLLLGQHTSEPAYWHDRLLWPAVQRMRGLHVFGLCNIAQHQDQMVSGYEQEVVATTQDRDFAAFVSALDSDDLGVGIAADLHAVAPLPTSSEAPLRRGPDASVTQPVAPVLASPPTPRALGEDPAMSVPGSPLGSVTSPDPATPPGPPTAPSTAPSSVSSASAPAGAADLPELVGQTWARFQQSDGGAGPALPDLVLDQDAVAALCASGQAERLLPDLTSPVWVDGRWWTVSNVDGEQVPAQARWSMLSDEHVSHLLDQMRAHQQSARKAVQSLPPDPLLPSAPAAAADPTTPTAPSPRTRAGGDEPR